MSLLTAKPVNSCFYLVVEQILDVKYSYVTLDDKAKHSADSTTYTTIKTTTLELLLW